MSLAGDKEDADRAPSRAIALTVAAALFMTSLDGAVLVTALPQMAETFGVASVGMSLGVVIYLVFQAAFLPAAGWVAERVGARRLFAGAIVGFVAASVACAFATAFWPFIGFRALQGLAASFMVPVGRIVLLHTTRKRDLINALNLSTSAGLLAPAVGPPLGGLIVTYWSWPLIFLLNVPIGLIGVLCVWRFIPDLKAGAARPFDFIGFLASAAAVACVLLGLEALAHRDGAVGGVLLLPIGLTCAAFALRHFRRTPHPLISLSPLRFQTFVTANLTGAALVRIPGRAGPFIYPLMFQVVFGMTALVSGLMVLALTAGDVLVKPLTRPALQRWGFRSVLIVSTVATGLTIAASAALQPDAAVALVFATLAALGVARSFVLTGLSGLSVADVPREQFADATALTNLAQQLVGAFGVSGAAIALSLSAAANGHPQTLDLGDCRLALLLAAVMTLAATASFVRLPRDAGAAISGHGR